MEHESARTETEYRGGSEPDRFGKGAEAQRAVRALHQNERLGIAAAGAGFHHGIRQRTYAKRRAV